MLGQRTHSARKEILPYVFVYLRIRDPCKATLFIKAAEQTRIDRSRHPLVRLDLPFQVRQYDRISAPRRDLLLQHRRIDRATVLAASAVASAAGF